MPIKVSCHCGQSFTAKDNLAGQTLLCPKCSQPLTIPNPNAPVAQRQASNTMGDLFDEVGIKEHKGPRCPSCAAPLRDPNSLLCTNCGYHLQTGEKLAGAKVYKAGERGHAEATDTLLSRAAQQIESDKVEEKKNQSSGLPWWLYFLALAALSGFVITMFLIPREKAFLVSGGCLIGFAVLMNTYYSIRMLIIAFQESTKCGLLYLFLPFYPLYYLITRWEKVGGIFLLQLMYSVIAGFGGILVALAPMMAKDKDDAVSLEFLVPRRSTVVAAAQFEPGKKYT